MADINSVVATGRLTRDAELRYSQNGSQSLRFSLAVNRSKKNPDGTWGEETSFIDCVSFSKGVDKLSVYLTKGKQIAVQGELRQSRWEGQDGQQRSKLEVVALNITLLGQSSSKGGDAPYGDEASSSRPQGSSGYSSSRQRTPMNQAAPEGPGPEDFQDDNIPF